MVWWSIESFQPYMVTCEKISRCTAIGMWSRLKKKKKQLNLLWRQKNKNRCETIIDGCDFQKTTAAAGPNVVLLKVWHIFFFFFLHTFNREHSTMKTCRRLHTKAGGVCGAKARGYFAAAGLPAHLKITFVLTWNTHMWQLDKNQIDWDCDS